MGMKIMRVFNGEEVTIELTQEEIAEAYLVHEHFYDCEGVRGDLNSGCYEEFEDLTGEKLEAAVHEIAYEARHQQDKYGLEEGDARDVARKLYIKNHSFDNILNSACRRSGENGLSESRKAIEFERE